MGILGLYIANKVIKAWVQALTFSWDCSPVFCHSLVTVFSEKLYLAILCLAGCIYYKCHQENCIKKLYFTVFLPCMCNNVLNN